IVTVLAHPVLPESTVKIWKQLGLQQIDRVNLADLKWGQLPLGGKLGDIEPVFPKADKTATIERMQQMEQERSTPPPATTQSSATPAEGATNPAAGVPAAGAAPAPAPPAAAPDGKISIDDFLKVELRVGQVKFAEKVKGADRLLRLEVDIGS